jgi:type IX secretion system PorP/SprF family membrane protein
MHSLIWISGQDPMFSQFMFRQTYFNPAYAGTSANPRIFGGYRNQWPGMNNAFLTYYLSYDQFIKSINSGIGVSVSRDAIANAIYNVTGIDMSYNYQFKSSDQLKLSFGLSAGMYQKARSANGIVLPDQSPYASSFTPENITSASVWYPDFGFGTTLLWKKKHMVSFAINHLNRPDISLNSDKFRMPFRLTFQYFPQFQNYFGNLEDKSILIKPGIIFQKQDRYNYISFGSNLEYNPFVCGLWLRNDYNFSLESFVILLGYSLSNFKFVYSYDLRLINFSGNILNNGAHEVTFQIDFQYKDRKKMREVKCPKF